MLFSGCGTTVVQEENSKVAEITQQESPYLLKEVVVSDVVLSDTIRCKYQEADSTDVLFAESDRKITAVYVKKGDLVEKGQLLFEFEGAEQSDEAERLQYEISRNETLLSFLDINENYERSEIWWNYVYKQDGSEEATERLQKSLDSIGRSYEYAREDYEDAINVAKRRLAEIETEVSTSRVYAPMDGRVKEILEDMVGTRTKADGVAMTLVDNTRSVFEVGGTSRAGFFPDGVPVTMQLGSGKNAVNVQVIPYNRENWTSKMFFELVDSDENPVIQKGSFGTITLELDRREQVLAVSKQVIHKSGDSSYVYVLGENDIREIRWVEVGLEGNELVEIISGLSEGESVILR